MPPFYSKALQKRISLSINLRLPHSLKVGANMPRFWNALKPTLSVTYGDSSPKRGAYKASTFGGGGFCVAKDGRGMRSGATENRFCATFRLIFRHAICLRGHTVCLIIWTKNHNYAGVEKSLQFYNRARGIFSLQL